MEGVFGTPHFLRRHLKDKRSDKNKNQPELSESLTTYGSRQPKNAFNMRKKMHSDHPAHVQSIIRAFAFHLYIFGNRCLCKRTETALTRLRGCAGWAGPYCPQLPEDTFLHGAVHVYSKLCKEFPSVKQLISQREAI